MKRTLRRCDVCGAEIENYPVHTLTYGDVDMDLCPKDVEKWSEFVYERYPKVPNAAKLAKEFIERFKK